MSAKILIVEDNADTRELLACTLEMEGYTVISAGDGSSAIERANAERPDLIITDINMPNMDGIQMIKIMRGHEVLKATPIVVISAYQSGIIKDALEAGATTAVKKPLEFEAFIKLIFSLLASMIFCGQ
jgi:two-component system chemotaxis response regulator CheY